jgi:hypothetical protein
MGISISCDGCYAHLDIFTKPTFEVVFKGTESVGLAYLCEKCLTNKKSIYVDALNPEYNPPKEDNKE